MTFQVTTKVPTKAHYDGKVWNFYADGCWRAEDNIGTMLRHQDMIQFASSNHAQITHYYIPELGIVVTYDQMLAIRKREQELKEEYDKMEKSNLDVADTVHWSDAGQCWPAMVMVKPDYNMGEPNLTLAVIQPDIYANMGEQKTQSTVKAYVPHGFGYNAWHRKEQCQR